MKKHLLRNTLMVSIALVFCASLFSSCTKNEDGILTNKTELLILIDSCQLLINADTTGYSPLAKTAYSGLTNELIVIQLSLLSPTLTQNQVNLLVSGLKITKTTLETAITISNATGTTAYLEPKPKVDLFFGQDIKKLRKTSYKFRAFESRKNPLIV